MIDTCIKSSRNSCGLYIKENIFDKKTLFELRSHLKLLINFSIFLGEGDPSKETIQASEGDVMSLYADMERKKVIFRKNGEQCIALSFDASDHLPCIGMHSVGEAVQIMDRNIWTQSSTSDVSCYSIFGFIF